MLLSDLSVGIEILLQTYCIDTKTYFGKSMWLLKVITSQTLNFLTLNVLKLFCLKWLAESFPELFNTIHYVDSSSAGDSNNAYFSCTFKV